MPWVKFDDQFPVHRKVAGLSDAAFRLHVSAIFWSARNLTDGFLPREDLGDVSARVRTPARFAAECVRRNAWHRAPDECASSFCPAPADGDGWVIHDYWEFQPKKEQVMKDRAAAARRQKAWRDKRKPRNAVSNGVSDRVINASPPRPEISGGGQSPPPRAAANGRASPAGSAARGHKPKPAWCGVCDRDTRLTGPPDQPYRCPECHPIDGRRTRQ